MEIHPEIRKFWGNRKIWDTRFDDTTTYYWVEITTDSGRIVAVHEDGEFFLKYRLGGQEYS